MKTFIRLIQVLTAILFITSGLVKANDPLGLSFKMQEFFELWSSSLTNSHLFFKDPLINLLEFLHVHSLVLSVFMITLEVIAGVALLLVWKRNFFLYLLLLLIIFFTFLTGYAYLSGKFTNCGCFGDCLPISPQTSFIKDVILLVMIVILLSGKKYLAPVLKPVLSIAVLLISLTVTIGIQLYVLTWLPLVDCLPFKKGNNINAQMKPPPNSVPDSFAIKFIYEKQGKRFEFPPDKLPADFTTYKFIDRKQALIRKGNAEPAIKSFSLTGISGEDSTS
ncbi:MAG TPA: MauE/DoxX family redox-associated membrane protein, partial [Flavisolibacter sp.]|nr:MauE/DoxX family redox-associated membrane protein [Flavisolibacter sp.]